jgi:hypothetical protein
VRAATRATNAVSGAVGLVAQHVDVQEVNADTPGALAARAADATVAMTVRAGSSSTSCPSISTKLTASDMKILLKVAPQWGREQNTSSTPCRFG